MRRQDLFELSDSHIAELAESVGMPEGWYNGPWFDEDNNLRTGIPPSLKEFAKYCVLAGFARCKDLQDE